MSGFSVYPFERFDFHHKIDHSTTLSFFFFNAKLSLRDNGLIAFVNFSFSSGCDLHDRSQKYQQNLVTLFWFGTSHFSN